MYDSPGFPRVARPVVGQHPRPARLGSGGPAAERRGHAPAVLSFIIALLCTLAPARGQSIGWLELAVPPRSEHTMVYDAARGVTVLFGGSTGTSSGETWEWNGSAWT